MDKISLGQVQYHQQRFNPDLLPDVAKAGPISASLLHDCRHPIRFLTRGDKTQNADMAWGSQVDCLWLTPEEWGDHFITLPEDPPRRPSPAQIEAVRKGTAKPVSINAVNFWKEWDEKAVGKQLISKEDLAEVRRARDVLDLHPISRQIWNDSEKQTVFFGACPLPSPEGTYAKIMLDLLPVTGPFTDAVVDLKQCHDISERGMTRAINRFEYHMKLGFYQECLAAAGDPRERAILIFQNSHPPHEVKVREIDPVDLQAGKALARTRLASLSQLNKDKLSELFDTEIKKISRYDWMREEEFPDE